MYAYFRDYGITYEADLFEQIYPKDTTAEYSNKNLINCIRAYLSGDLKKI